MPRSLHRIGAGLFAAAVCLTGMRAQAGPSGPSTPIILAQAAAPDAPAVVEGETECEKLAAFHMPVTTAQDVHEATATDWTHAAKLCQADVMAHPGDPRFVYALGRAQDHLGNYIEAQRDFRAAAEAGHVDALVELGRLYYAGHGVLQSYPQAFEAFNRAASAGSTRALANVAAMYGNGQGVARDDVKALDAAEKAIEAGNPYGLEIVANAYFFGRGVPRDYKMAAQYLQQSADLGDGRSLKFLANMYEAGYLGKPDPGKASELRLQAQRVDPESQDPVPAHLAMLRQTPIAPVVHRRYVLFRPYRPNYMGQPMVGGIFKAPAPGARCCPPSALICPGALPRC
jgi:tetratricopeptide (TPR) repeat protein